MKRVHMQTFKVVSPDIIEKAAQYFIDIGEPDNNFARLLEYAKQYEEADMTPIFLMDSDNSDIYIVCKETFNQKLH